MASLLKAIHGTVGLLTGEWRSKLLIYYISSVVVMKRPLLHQQVETFLRTAIPHFRMRQHDYILPLHYMWNSICLCKPYMDEGPTSALASGRL